MYVFQYPISYTYQTVPLDGNGPAQISGAVAFGILYVFPVLPYQTEHWNAVYN